MLGVIYMLEKSKSCVVIRYESCVVIHSRWSGPARSGKICDVVYSLRSSGESAGIQ